MTGSLHDRRIPTLGRAAGLAVLLGLAAALPVGGGSLLPQALAANKPAKPAPAPPAKPSLNDEQMQTALELIRIRRPALAARLEMLRAEDRRTTINKMMPRFRWLLDMKRSDPAGFELYKQQWELETKAGETARKFRAAKGPEAEKLKKDLRELAEDYVELHHKILDHEVSRLEQKISGLRNEIQSQQDHRDKAVERHLQRLLSLPTNDELAAGNADTTPPKKEEAKPAEQKK